MMVTKEKSGFCMIENIGYDVLITINEVDSAIGDKGIQYRCNKEGECAKSNCCIYSSERNTNETYTPKMFYFSKRERYL